MKKKEEKPQTKKQAKIEVRKIVPLRTGVAGGHWCDN